MQQLLAAELLAATSNEGFSLDELVLQLRECMTEKGLPAILRLILDGTSGNSEGNLRQLFAR